MQEVLDEAYKSIMPELLANVSTKTTMHGATLEAAESGVKYDYKSDLKWQELTERAKPYIDAVKIQEERIKMATKIKTALVDEDTGEVLARPVLVKSTSIVKVTLGAEHTIYTASIKAILKSNNYTMNIRKFTDLFRAENNHKRILS